MTNYEFTKVSPQQLMLQIRYTKDGLPDYWINATVTDFSESNLHRTASDNAFKAEGFWQNISQLPEEVVPEELTGVAKPRVYVDAPDHNDLTHNVSFEWVESDDSLTQTWTISEKTEEEKAQALTQWREWTQVTMRQARLALAQEGLLENVEDAIALIPEPDKSAISIEWEYSATVERTSSWVSVLAPALGLSDDEIDDLFKVASNL